MSAGTRLVSESWFNQAVAVIEAARKIEFDPFQEGEGECPLCKYEELQEALKKLDADST